MSPEPENLPQVASISTFSIPGPESDLPIRVYTPNDAGSEAPCLLYFHAGGWINGSLDGSDGICRHIANETSCVVISVDYRLAPEHPFPAGFEDCYAATEYVANNPEMFGIDPDRLAVGGCSAGGNLAAALSLAARDRNGPEICHQLLAYPVLGLSFDTDSYRENASGYMLNRAGMKSMWKLYLQTSYHTENPYAVPLRAKTFDNLPSATVVTAGFDPLRDDGMAYVDRLKNAGVPVSHRNFEDMIHGFIEMTHTIDLTRGHEALDHIGDQLRSAFTEKQP